MNDFVYIIIANVVQTIEKKDNKVAEKVDNLYNDLNIEKQPKDLYNDLRTTERNIELISNLDFDIDRLKKFFIVFKSFNLRVKIPENIFYIIMKNDIYIYLKDL